MAAWRIATTSSAPKTRSAGGRSGPASVDALRALLTTPATYNDMLELVAHMYADSGSGAASSQGSPGRTTLSLAGMDGRSLAAVLGAPYRGDADG